MEGDHHHYFLCVSLYKPMCMNLCGVDCLWVLCLYSCCHFVWNLRTGSTGTESLHPKLFFRLPLLPIVKSMLWTMKTNCLLLKRLNVYLNPWTAQSHSYPEGHVSWEYTVEREYFYWLWSQKWP
jgi:hypothetical protein